MSLLSAAHQTRHATSIAKTFQIVTSLYTLHFVNIAKRDLTIYMQYICRIYAVYMQYICSIYAVYMQYICSIYAVYMQYICSNCAYKWHSITRLWLADATSPRDRYGDQTFTTATDSGSARLNTTTPTS